MSGASASPREMLAERLFGLTHELAALDGVAGHEQPVVARLVELLRPLVRRVEVDSFGNVFAWLPSDVERPVLMVTAHSDEIGLLVKGIEPNGFLRIEKVGGVIDSQLPGRHVRVRGYRGVIGVRPGHLVTAEEQRSVPPVRDLYVDLGFDSAEDVLALGIQVGDPVAYDEPVERLANPRRISGKALDNRVSCALLVALAERLRDVELGCQLVLVITVQEEVGLRGAQMAAYRLAPDAAIVVDTVPAGGTPDTDLVRDLGIRIGGGPVLALASGMGVCEDIWPTQACAHSSCVSLPSTAFVSSVLCSHAVRRMWQLSTCSEGVFPQWSSTSRVATHTARSRRSISTTWWRHWNSWTQRYALSTRRSSSTFWLVTGESMHHERCAG